VTDAEQPVSELRATAETSGGALTVFEELALAAQTPPMPE
jgi:hypothetical protein